MRDRKELIDILECCHEDDCWHCPAALTDDRPCNGATELSIPVPVFIFDDVQKLLKEQEQKHGHWKGFTQSRFFGMDDYGEPIFRDGFFYVCSECRRKSIIKYPYCPHCGTRMDRTVDMDD